MRFRFDRAVCLTAALAFGFGAAFPVHGEAAKPTKVGKDQAAKMDKSILVANGSNEVWTFGVLLQDNQNDDTKGKIEVWQSGPLSKGKPTLVQVANWSAAGSITMPPGAEIVVAPKPAGTFFRDPIQRTCYVKDAKGGVVYFVVAREVKDKTPRIDYLLKSRALYASQFSAKEDEDQIGPVTYKSIGSALTLELRGSALMPLLTISADALPKAGTR